jgi:hypothetical protein
VAVLRFYVEDCLGDKLRWYLLGQHRGRAVLGIFGRSL